MTNQEAIELAYGLLWHVEIDISRPRDRTIYEARQALLGQLTDMASRERGIAAAKRVMIRDRPIKLVPKPSQDD